MKKILIAVDETKGSLKIVDLFAALFPCVKPETVVLLYVEKIEGWSVMDDLLLSESEIETLKEAVKNTAYQEILDKRAEKVINYYKKSLEEKGVSGIKPVVKEGHPAEEILATAKEEGVDMIIIGARSKRVHNLFIGSVSREVVNRAEIPVLIVK